MSNDAKQAVNAFDYGDVVLPGRQRSSEARFIFNADGTLTVFGQKTQSSKANMIALMAEIGKIASNHGKTKPSTVQSLVKRVMLWLKTPQAKAYLNGVQSIEVYGNSEKIVIAKASGNVTLAAKRDESGKAVTVNGAWQYETASA